jgi:hypothetical protein
MRRAWPWGLLVAACSSNLTPFAAGDATVDAFVFTGDAAGEGSVDAGADAMADVPFVCGASVCDPATQYCIHYLPEGGLSPEGGGNVADQCLPLAPKCSGMATCDCVEAMAPCEAGVELEGCIEGVGVELTCPPE